MRNVIKGFLFSLALSAAALMPAGPAQADSLFGAMEKAYSTNPTLNGARAGQRATDEQVPQALSGWRPTVTVNGEVSHNWEKSSGVDPQEFDSGRVSITLNQPIFRGFGTVESTKAAEAQVDAGRQKLLQTEQDVLFAIVQTYMNVYTGRQLVALEKQNVAAFRSQLNASNERFGVGEITRTDVAQSRSRLAEAQAQLTNAEANLAGDVAEYMQIIGNEPGKLKYPPITMIPKSLKSAQTMAGEINPEILAKAFVEVAAQHQIGVRRAGLLPTADIQATAILDDNRFGNGIEAARAATITASVRIPLYEAGEVYSRVREAKQLASQQRIAVIEIARAVRQAVAASWNAYVGLGDIIRYARTQVSAAELALSGVQQEYQAGTRTTLDVLDAQSELITARRTLVNAERRRVFFAYQLLSAVGHLTARDLGLNVVIYDPEQNYHRVRDKWIGTDVETLE